MEKVHFGGWPNCIRLANKECELIVTTDIGPRIVKFGFINSQNFFHLSSEDSGKTGGDEWRIYGGHRLWVAPEVIPLSYYPDNHSVKYSSDGDTIKLTQEKEVTTGIVKEMEITLSSFDTQATVIHRLINQGSDNLEISVWALSVLAQGGSAIIPQEPFGEGDDYLLPARPLALWQYTKMNDPRWTWGEKFIQAKQDPAITSEQKIGVLNKQGWVAYNLNKEILIKKFSFMDGVIYPDFNCNNEIYINGNFLEVETLSPLTNLALGGVIEHTERWYLKEFDVDEKETSIDDNILSLIKDI